MQRPKNNNVSRQECDGIPPDELKKFVIDVRRYPKQEICAHDTTENHISRVANTTAP